MSDEQNGSWPVDCLQRAFVDGGRWWKWKTDGWTTFPSEVDQLEAEAVRRYGEPAVLPVASTDPVNHPAHYTHGGIEVIDAIEAWNLGYHLGNVVKYVARAEHKGNYLQDLQKARWYLQREIDRAGLEG